MTANSLDLAELLETWNNHSTPEWTSTVPELFAAQCAATPEAVAVVHGGRELTYRQLAEHVAQLAHAIRATADRPEAMVAVGVPRSAEMVVGVLAALIAGAAFVPLDPSWPLHRRQQVLADSGAVTALVTADDHSQWGVSTLRVDLEDWRFADRPTESPRIAVQPVQLAYVIFTSGSTGKPKGAMIRHEAIAERLQWQRDQILMFGDDDAALFKAPLSFDISVNEILLPLVSGGRVVVAEPDGEKDPEYLLELIRTQRVTFVYLVSSMLDTLLELDRLAQQDGADSSLESLRHVWCGGEVLTPGLFTRFRRQLSTTLYHGYGPAEATIGVSHVIYRDSAERIATSIGRPNPHTQLYVLDDEMRPVPPGVGGELYAAGFLLGRGYVNASSLTSARFVANPFGNSGSRMYRTGDLARWTDDGSLEFLGRADNQVKIRGRRIELEEIESQLADHPAVRQAVVDVHRHGGADHLVGYLVAGEGVTNDAAFHDDIASWTLTRLPDYMVPTLFVGLDRVPLTANGKIDRRALPAPDLAGPRTATAPRTPREAVLCQAFADALDLDAVGVDEDFFGLGGDSIVAIRVVSRVRQQGYVLRPRDMFAHRTAEVLAPLLTESAAATPRIDAVDPTGPVPATPILRWLDTVDSSTPAGSVLDGFYQGMSLVTPNDLDEEVLRAALAATLARHPALWASTERTAAALTIPEGPPPLRLTTVESHGGEVIAAVHSLREDLVSALDPSAGAMIGFGWIRRPHTTGRLVVIAHHIVIDGVSLRILAEDIAGSYGVGRPLSGEETSWRSWAHQLDAAAAAGGPFDEDLQYWQDTCATVETAWGERPLEPGVDTVATEARLTVELSPAVSEAILTTIPDRIHGHVNDALVAALYLALRQWRVGDATLLIEMEGHGREGHQVGDVDLSSTVGWFTTLYPVALSDAGFDWRAALLGGPALAAAVRSVKEQLRAVPSHGLSYGALRYRSDIDATLAAQPQVLFNYLGRFDTSDRPWSFAADGGAVLEDRDPAMPLPRLLEVNAEAATQGGATVLRATFSWPSGVLSEAEVARLADAWTAVLTSICATDEVRGHSVSDFSRVTLEADDVTDLEVRYPGLVDVVPLTSTQQGIYFHSTFSNRADPYVVQQIVDITGPLDVERFQRATGTVIARHRALAAAFTTIADGTPVAVYAAPAAPDFEFVDAAAHADPDALVAQRARYERDRRFDLSSPPLTRYTLIRRRDDVHTMIQTVHHIVADGWSVPIVLEDLLTAYAGADFTGPAQEFIRFVDWQHRCTEEHEADRAAWAAVLDGVETPTRLAVADGAQGFEAATGFGSRTTVAGSRRALAAAAAQSSVSVGTLLHTVWGVTVGRLTGLHDVLFGTVVSGRGGDLPGVEDMVGLLVNTVPVRVAWTATDRMAEVAARLAAIEADVVEHHHLPLLEAQQIAGVGELFDTLMVIENLGPSTVSAGELTLGDIDVVEAPHYPLTVMIAVHETVTVTVTNNRDHISDAFAESVAAAFQALLDAVVADPATACATPALGQADPPRPATTATTVTALLDAAVADHRDATALVTSAGELTFGQLHARASALAAALADAGVGRGDIVALALTRSSDVVAALWATLLAGAAYLPVDLSYPHARIQFMLAHGDPRVVLVDEPGAAVLSGAIPPDTAVLRTDEISSATTDCPPVQLGPLDAVSLLFTSGSTGEPKAVLGTHGALANRLSWATDAWPATTRIAKSSLAFIDGTTELLAGLVAGARTVLVEDAREGRRLAELVGEHQVTQLLAVPALAAVLAEENPDELRSLNRWIVSGETLEQVHLDALRAACPQAVVVNSYGSSEVTGDVLAGEQLGDITLGAVVPGAGIHLLGADLRDLPCGVIGEIYVSGAQLARGYLGRSGLTAARFVAAADGARMYRTGDLGARLTDGRVVFAGRADDQVKINGHRVEPGEVENMLLRQRGVLEAAVLGTDAGLAAFVVTGSADLAAVRAALTEELPRHLVPASVQVISAIPLLPNGKRDSGALRALAAGDNAASGPMLAPVDDLQRTVVEVMADVLGGDTLSADADFFGSGGDSISAIRVSSRLARAGFRVSTEDVFRRRTAIGIAALISAAPVDSTDEQAPIARFETAGLSPAAVSGLTEHAAAEDVWAMSPLQQGVYYQSTLTGASHTYLAQNTFDFDRRIEVDAMQQAFTALLTRHPQLRVGFHTVEDADTTALVQVVSRLDAVNTAVRVLDLRTDDREDIAGAVQRRVAADRNTPFDLTAPPLLRLTIIQLPDGRDRMLLTYHFLLFDGWSRELVLRELFALYDSRGVDGALEPHGGLVVAYLRWLGQNNGAKATEAADAWGALLAGLTGPSLASGVEPGHPDAAPDQEPGRVIVSVPQNLTERLHACAGALGVTLNAVVTTAVSMVTGYHAGTSDVVLGATVAGRPGELVGIDETIGLFLNTVPVRVDVSPTTTAATAVRAVNDQRVAMMRHDHLGLGQIQRAAGDSSRALFDSLLVLQNFLDDDTFTELESHHGIVGVDYHDTTHFPLTWVLTPGRELTVKLEYRVVGEDLAREMVAALLAVLEAIAEAPHAALGGLPLLDARRRRELAQRWSSTTRPVEPVTVAELLGRQAQEHPDDVAVVFGPRQLTYREFDDKVSQFARYLRAHGAVPETFVALALPRSIEMVVALFAVLRAGAAYLPLELDLPIDRLRTIVEDARPVLLVTTSAHAALMNCAAEHGAAVLAIDETDTAAALAETPSSPLTAAELGGFAAGTDRLQHPAYLIYTSGSTGRPKGVLTAYAGLTNMYFNHREAIFEPTVRRAGTDGQIAVAHTVSFSFDMSWEELFWLVEGHRVHICDEELRRDAPALVAYCHAHRVDVINVTPTYAHHLLDAGLLDAPGGHPPALVLLGGEAVGDTVWNALRAHPDTAAYNLYGPTEYTINTLGGGTDDSATPTVGQPIWNTRGYLLDTALRPVPDGATGELYIAGTGLARGYHHRAGLTANAMVADPFVPGGRMYRTGDLVRRRGDGNLDFLGRADDQVKIRGYRVELGEIEAALSAAPEVARAAVVVRTGSGTPPVKTLAAYVIPAQPPAQEAAFIVGIRDVLAAALPAYMVPTRYGVVSELPLTINGKLDVGALPEPVAPTRGETRAPRSPQETTLLAVIAGVLGIDGPISVDDDFFALGGDSISSIAVCGRARKAGLHLTPRDVFRRRTIAALAGVATATVTAAVVAPDTGVGEILQTPMLAETARSATPLTNFYQSMVLATPPEITGAQLELVLTAVLRAHGMLRARLDVTADGWTLTVPVPDVDTTPALTVHPGTLTGEDIGAATSAAAAQLAPEDGMMVRAVWYDAADGPGQLLLVIHHLVIDGVSWRILGEDLARAWSEIAAGRPAQLDEVPTSFRTWSTALGQAAFGPEAPHWNSILATADPDLGRRPLDPAVDTANTVVSQSFSLPAEVSAALLSTVPAAIHGGVNEVLLTAFSLALTQWRAGRGQGAGATVLNLEGHGREAELIPGHLDLSRTIGWFTAIYPVRIDPGELTWAQVLAADAALATATKRVKEQLRGVPSRGLGYGALRHLDSTAPVVGASPQILFNYLGRFAGGSGRAWEPVAHIGALREGVDPTNPAEALEINALAEDRPGGPVLTMTLAWPGGLLDAAEVEALATLWSQSLTALTRCAPLRGHTPSDFPLVDLHQADLDEWERLGPVEDVLPLLPLQQGMYFHSTLGAGITGYQDTYRVQQIAELSGPVDPNALRDSIGAVLHRHQALRASFRERQDGLPAQVIWQQVPIEFDSVDAHGNPDRVETLAQQQLSLPFDLASAPLVRYLLVTVGPDEHRLIQTMHHIVADGWSYPVIFGDVIAGYNAAVAGDPRPSRLRVTLRDHIEFVTAGDLETARGAWSDALAGVEQTTLFARAGDATSVGEHRSCVLRLSPELTGALTQTARDRGLTLSSVLHGAWGVLLGRLLGRRRVVFGSTVSGRGGELADTDSIVGLLINTIPVPMSWESQTPIATVFADLQDQQSTLLDAQHVGLADMARMTGIRDLFDTMVVVENFPTVAAAGTEHPNALHFNGFTGTDAPHYPMSFVAYLGERLTVEIKYDASVVSAAYADRCAQHLEHILAAFVEQPDQAVSRIDLRTQSELDRVGGAVARPGPARTLRQGFAESVRRAPDAVALSSGAERLTYAELDARASVVATALTAQGVGPESRVAVALPRSVPLIVALLGVSKSGGTYVPLDIDSPAARIQHILTDADPVCVLVDRADRLTTALPVLVVDELLTRAVHHMDVEPDLEPHPDHSAYLIYTSGSTGVPKGVAVSHRNVAALFSGAEQVYDFDHHDVWTMFHSAAFDFSVWELWGPLLHGGRLVLVEQSVARDPERMLELLSRERVTVLNQTPSAFYPLIEADRRSQHPLALRYIIFGGEALDTSRLAAWFERHDAASPQLVNMYGITETCVHVSHRPLAADDTRRPASVIGAPLPGLQIHLLDDTLAPVPTGVVGEIYVAGGQLARGYVGRPDLTATRFVANPFDAAGDRLYRSGDTAMWTEEGELVYVGRSDQQVKVRGYRIELGEVESALAAVPGIANAAAAARADSSGRVRLIGYLVGRDHIDITSVRADLEHRLPGYMVPSVLVALDALPLTVNGKLDRAALPDPEESPAVTAVPDSAPAGAADQLAALCSEILRTAIGVDDDFFNHGGDSIVAIQLVNRARRLGVRITPQQVFTCRTPAALAEAAGVDTTEVAAASEDSGPDNGEVMLTPIVQRLAELGGSAQRFNQSELLRVPAGATHAHLETALDAVLRRHDALRLRLHRPAPMLWSLETTAGQPLSLLHVPVHNGDEAQLRELIGVHSDAAADRLDPEAGAVLQAVWFDRGAAEQGRLLLVVHHLAVDAVSWRIIIDDLAEAYGLADAGRPAVLPSVPTSIRGYARTVNENAQQAARLAEFEHWTATLAPGGELEPQANTFDLTVGRTRDHEVWLTVAQTTPLLTTVPALANADVTETLVSALMLAVRRWRAANGSPAAPLVLDLERHGRDGWDEALDLSRTVGWFTAIAPVRLPADGAEDLVTALKDVKEQLRAVPDSGLGYGQLRYCNPRTAAALGRLPAPQVLFNYLGRWPADGTGDWVTAPEADALRVAPDPDLGTPYVLEINAVTEDTEDGPRLSATFTYADGELTGDAVRALADNWATVLAELGALVAGSAGTALTPSDLALIRLTQQQIDTATAAIRQPVETIWPLSPLQEGVYFQARYSDAAVYIVQNTFDFADAIDVEALGTAYRTVMARNPVLRSAFWADDLPQPVAVIAADPVCEPEVVDLTGLASGQIEDRLDQLTAEDRLRTFDLDQPPLARFTVIRTTRGDRLLFSYHFLLLDGWSREQLLRELFAEYAAARKETRTELPAPTADFTDYLRWLSSRDQAISAQRWAERLGDLAAPTLLVPAAVGTAPTLALRLDFTLTEAQTTQLSQFARSTGVTLNALISAALALVLGYETGSDDVVFGSTVAGRPTDVDGIDSVIGLFLNTVPTRVRLAPDGSLSDLMRAVQNDRLVLMDHEHLGLGDIQRAVGANGPLFDNLYVLQNFLDDDTFTELESEHGIVGHDSIDASHYPLTWMASPGRRLWVKLEYRPDVVDRAYAQRLLDRLEQILRHAGSSGAQTHRLAAAPLALTAEAADRGVRGESTRHPLPTATVMDLLAQRSVTTTLPALVCGADSIDSGELDRRVNQLGWLLRDRGYGADNTVALAIPRSITAVVALFGVLRSGAAYLPLELDYPDERLAVMLADAAPACVLTTRATAARIAEVLPAGCALVVLDNPDVAAQLDAARSDWDGHSPRLDDPAYVIYTSGSTGRPKGVVTPHRGLTNMHLNHREAIFAPAIAKAGGRRLRIAHTVSFSFDMSWEELLWLIEGHEVHICDENLRRDATALVAYCHEHRIDVVNVTPTYAGLLFEQGLLDPAGHPPVLVLLGGEAVSNTVWNRLHNSETSYGYNLYGPTEYTINTLGGGTDDSDSPTVGQPIWNTRAHILDSWLRPVPDGLPGELYIAGAGLARGYLGQSAMTAGRFVADPFPDHGAGGRMYRTGDLVVRRTDGNLDFLGRTDDQVKIRGYRVEPGDIETVLAAHPRVTQAAVIARPDPTTSGSHRLIGYVVSSTSGSPADRAEDSELIAELRAHLKTVLPAYMVPSAMAVLDELPLTDNGKLDVRALPEARAAGLRTQSRAPQSPQEQTLCALFAEILGVSAVGVDDNFFDIGGHSLLSIRLINRIRAELGAAVSLRDVFDSPTVAELAALVATEPSAPPQVRPVLAAAPRPQHIPASPAQERLLILDRLGDSGLAYNYPLVFGVRGRLDISALRQAVGDVLDRHESLRTVFGEHDGVLFQDIRPIGTRVPVEVIDCPPDELDAHIAAAVGHRFDLRTEVPMRVQVFETGPEDHTVVVLLHHITTDEWSDTPFLTDLDHAYESRTAGTDPGWDALAVQYADHTLWQRELLALIGDDQLGFWRDTLAGAPDELTLPTDRPRPTRPSGAGGALHVELPPETAAALRELAAQRQISALMVLHAAVAVLLHRLGTGDDIVVGTPVAGRDETALNDVVGFFVNTLVLRTDLSGNPSVDELLRRVRTGDLAAFAHQELPFERLVEHLNPPRVAGRNPLFNVFVGYHRSDGQDTTMFGLPTRWQDPPVAAAMFDLGFTLIDGPPGGSATIMAEFSSDLFDESSVLSLTRRLAAVLGQLADTSRPVGSLDLLLDTERTTLVAGYNNTDHAVESTDLAAMFSLQAQRTPDAVAVVFDGEEVSYTEVDQWSDRLAAILADAGARTGTVIGICLPRSVELVVALIAVAKTGAAFLPLDPEYPPDRLAYMVDDARPATVLDDPVPVRAARAGQPGRARPTVEPASWAYVLYTSGSTGQPKGVAVPHAGITNRIAWLQHAYPLTTGDRLLVKTPISFDTSVWEVFWPLSAGATAVIARPGGHRDPRYLAETVVAQQVTAVDFVPSMLELFLEEPRAADCTSLSRVTVGGEALSEELSARFGAMFGPAGVPLHNLYGPTEASVDVLGWTADGGPVALGMPGWNVRAYVLDEYLNPVPAAAPGELYLAGVQLADGYLHRHGLTAQSFVANPFEVGNRMYRTGDVVRWRLDGQLEYLGRTDDQIKLRGVRIEPGEIETVVTRHPGVASTRVVVRDERLVAYYLPTAQAPTAGSLREHAASALPVHMVPSTFMAVADFPLTPSGKLDRNALPAPEVLVATGRPPETERQQRLCELFSEVLGSEVTSVDADFFTLGGHSLLLVRLAAALRREFDVELPVADLMTAATVSDVDARLDGTHRTTTSLAPVLPLRVGGSSAPLFCVHPASGLSWQFAGLKQHLPQEVPIYGLQSPLFTGTALPDTIAELAAGYADTVARTAPTGPIRLLGWSFGGSLAVLIAQELLRRGRDVSWLGVLDARIDADADQDRVTFDPAAVLASLLREMGFPVDPDERLSVAEAVALVRDSGDTIAVLDDHQIALVIENYVAAEGLTAAADYGRYPGEVFFVDASILEMDFEGVASAGWQPYFGGEVRVLALDCRHSELMDADTLDRLGPAIAAELERTNPKSQTMEGH